MEHHPFMTIHGFGSKPCSPVVHIKIARTYGSVHPTNIDKLIGFDTHPYIHIYIHTYYPYHPSMTGNITKFASRFTPSFQRMSGIHGVLEAHVDAQRHRAARRAAAAARGATQGAHAMLVLQSQTWRWMGDFKPWEKVGKP